jgi:hypothetical protein
MARNQKLTKLIAGRTVKAVTPAPGGVLILFDGQSSMRIKTGSAAAMSPTAQLKGEPADGFERVVVDLPLKMGYGGNRAAAGQAIGKSGDQGLDGIIKEDMLGLEISYLQAERRTATIGRP